MKKNRRQELQTNILADRLGGVIQNIRPYLKATVIIVAVAVVVLGGYLWRRSSSQNHDSALWQKFLAISFEAELAKSSSPDALSTRSRLERELDAYSSVAADLEALAEANKGTSATGWIRSAAGDALLSVGMRQLYSDQPEARQAFLRAKAIYQDLMGAATADEELYDRIRYGYGQACEGLSLVDVAKKHEEHLGQAQETYRDLAQNAKSTGIKRLAEYRLRILSPITGKTWEEGKIALERGDWASWLAQQELPEELSLPPGAGTNHFPALQNGGNFDPSSLPTVLPQGGNDLTDPALPKDPDAPPAAEKDDPKPAEPAVPPTEKGAPEPSPKKDDAKPTEPPKK